VRERVISVTATRVHANDAVRIRKFLFPRISLKRKTDHSAPIKDGPAADIGNAITMPIEPLAIKKQA
jgi:hypothetical protein